MRALTVIVILSLIAIGPRAAESIYPAAAGISASYTLSGTSLDAGDTLTITRQLTNNAGFPLTGLYLAEHLPSGLQIVSGVVTVNNVPVTAAYSTLPQGSVLGNHTSHFWTVSQPGVPALPAGQALRLVLKLTFTQPGSYALPLHTAAFAGNSNPYFATGDAVTVTVTQSVDTTPPAAIGDLHPQ